jgi:carbonic anhydrase
MIPLGVLSAVLIFTGWKMCEPVIWKHIAHIGREQLVIYSFTIAATLLTDLLVGIAVGVAAKFVMNALMCRQAVAFAKANGIQGLSMAGCLRDFFCNPVYKREFSDGVYSLYLDKPLVCFNSMQLTDELDKIPADAKSIRVCLDQRVMLIDHTSAENLMHTIREYAHSDLPVEIIGLDQLERLSHHDACIRVACPVIKSS